MAAGSPDRAPADEAPVPRAVGARIVSGGGGFSAVRPLSARGAPVGTGCQILPVGPGRATPTPPGQGTPQVSILDLEQSSVLEAQ